VPAFLRVAALRLPTLTAVEPSEPAVTTPGAGRFVRLLGWRGSGAGVLRAVLARRGRSIVAVAVAPAGSTLAALLREEVGRFGGRGSSTGAGVAAAEVRRGRVLVAVSTMGFFASFFAGFLGSFVGGKIGVEDFLGDERGAGTESRSVGPSRGVMTDSEAIDGADSAWVRGDTCFVEIG